MRKTGRHKVMDDSRVSQKLFYCFCHFVTYKSKNIIRNLTNYTTQVCRIKYCYLLFLILPKSSSAITKFPQYITLSVVCLIVTIDDNIRVAFHNPNVITARV